jgi:hypothetical protein
MGPVYPVRYFTLGGGRTYSLKKEQESLDSHLDRNKICYVATSSLPRNIRAAWCDSPSDPPLLDAHHGEPPQARHKNKANEDTQDR